MDRPRTILDTISVQAESHPQATAVLGVDGHTITYRQLQRQVYRIAAELRANHIRRTDKVVTVLPNGPHAAVGFLGTASCAIAVPLNPDLTQTDFVYCFRDLNANSLVIDRGLNSAAFAAAEECGVKIIEYPFPLRNARFERDTEDVASNSRPAGDDVALILYTSGTTSAPKRVHVGPETRAFDARQSNCFRKERRIGA